MKKITFLFILMSIFALSAFAQTKVDYSGEWTLDKEKSQLDERMSRGIESQTLTVVQTEKDLKITTETKRAPRPEGEGNRGGGQPPMGGGQGGGRGGMGGGRGGFGGGGDGTNTYTLDGKETTVDLETPNGKIPVKLKGELVDGKLNLQSSRTFSGPMGEMTITTKENWQLSADGKTLTIKRETESPRGTMSSEAVYAKKN